MHSRKDDILAYTLAFQRGEEKGFNYFFTSLYPSLVYFAFNILNDRQAAEDIAEESFIRIWRQHADFDHPSTIKAWLYTTTRNHSLNTLRKAKTQFAYEQQFAKLYADENEPIILQKMVRAEFLYEIQKVMNCLPKECKKIFMMLYIEGKTVRETAGELKLSISTVKTQKKKGLAYIRAKLLVAALCIIVNLLA